MKTSRKSTFNSIKQPILVTLVLLAICGFGYPLLLTGLAQVMFPHQANGSLIEIDGKIVGSKLIGQNFTEDYFMKPRPSAVNYNTYTQEQKDAGEYGGVGSGSKNYSATNPQLLARVEEDLKKFLQEHPSIKSEDIPTDLLTASGSGLDPHISPKSANIQLDLLVQTTGLSRGILEEIVQSNTEGKGLGLFGQNKVNVLGVNLAIAKHMSALQK